MGQWPRRLFYALVKALMHSTRFLLPSFAVAANVITSLATEQDEEVKYM